jgi:hypothetical protein
VFSYRSFLASSRAALTRQAVLTAAVSFACSVLALSVACASASAGVACRGESVSSPFVRWGDANVYALAPGGDFESGLTGWALTGGAKQVTGSEIYGATGVVGKYSLELPQGASATSPYMCVEANYPTFRFFARNGSKFAGLSVEVLYKNTLLSGGALSGAIGVGSAWGPSPEMRTDAVVGGVLSGGSTAQLALRFRATSGTSRIDDTFVDPRMR